MKFLFTLITFIFFTVIINAQCDYTNGSFENWEDVTTDIDSTGYLPANTVTLPIGHPSLARFLTMIFGSVFSTGTPEFLNYWSNGFGLSADNDAFTGEKAMRIGGDNIVPFADVFTAIPCNMRPKKIKFSYKHVGTGNDTLGISCIASTVIPNLFEDFDPTQHAGFAIDSIVSNTNESEYTTVSFPFTNHNSITDVDTISTQIFVAGNEDFFANSGTSYFLIDNVTFVYDDSPTHEIDAFSVDIYPNPALNFINIVVHHPVELEIFNIYGQLVHKENLAANENQISCGDWISGNYVLKMTDKQNQVVFHKVVVE